MRQAGLLPCARALPGAPQDRAAPGPRVLPPPAGCPHTEAAPLPCAPTDPGDEGGGKHAELGVQAGELRFLFAVVAFVHRMPSCGAGMAWDRQWQRQRPANSPAQLRHPRAMARLQIAWTRRLTAQEVEENVKRHKALSSKRQQFVAGACLEGWTGVFERQQDGQLFSWAAGPCMQKDGTASFRARQPPPHLVMALLAQPPSLLLHTLTLCCRPAAAGAGAPARDAEQPAGADEAV